MIVFFSCRTDVYAVRGLVTDPLTRGLSHGDSFRISPLPAVGLDDVFIRDEILHPIHEATRAVTGIVCHAGRKIEMTVRAYGPDRADGDAQTAFNAGVEIKGSVIFCNLWQKWIASKLFSCLNRSPGGMGIGEVAVSGTLVNDFTQDPDCRDSRF